MFSGRIVQKEQRSFSQSPVKHHSRRHFRESHAFVSPLPVKARNRLTPTGYLLKKNKGHEDNHWSVHSMQCGLLPKEDHINHLFCLIEGTGFAHPQMMISEPFEELDSSEEEDLGKLLVSLVYYPKEEIMRVTVERGMELDTSYLYLKLWLVRNQMAEKRRSPIRRLSSSPVFNCHFDFVARFAELASFQLVVAVLQFDNDSANDELGHVFFGSESNRTGVVQWQEMIRNPAIEVKRWHKLTLKWI